MAKRRLSVRHVDYGIQVYDRDRCQGRYPLARVSRIVATCRVDWSGSALHACLSEGITVAFVDGSGRHLGSFTPAIAQPSPISELLEELITDARWSETFDNFMRHLRSRVLRAWIRRNRCAPLPTADVDAWRRCYVYHAAIPVGLQFDYRGLLRSLVDAKLYAEGIRARYVDRDGLELDLAEHLCALVYGALVMHRGTVHKSISGDDVAIRFFESSVDYQTRLVERALRALRRLLLNRCRQWQ